jgi:hypothetical protein
MDAGMNDSLTVKIWRDKLLKDIQRETLFCRFFELSNKPLTRVQRVVLWVKEWQRRIVMAGRVLRGEDIYIDD